MIPIKSFALLALLVLQVYAPPAPTRADLFEGDIAGVRLPVGVSTGEIQKYLSQLGKNGVTDLNLRWPGGIMYYTISEEFTEKEKALIINATEEFNTKTANFRMVKRIDATHYVYINRGQQFSGCWSYVGLIGGEQTVNLEVAVNQGDPHCMHHGIVVHELLHAAGFWHEQSRTDRDDYVEINWDNISPDQQHNFLYYSSEASTSFDVPYDYESVMHYGRYDFAIDRTLWTIRPKAPNEDVPIGQRVGLSENDIRKIDSMYPKRS